MGKCTRDKRDLYYRSAKQEGWRARSAFKLLSLDKSGGGRLFHGVKRAVDLCAAPGSWSQVLSQKIYLPNQTDSNVKIVAVDFQFMVPIPGVIQLQGDITRVSTAEKILAEFAGEKADLVVCDGAPDVTGFHDLDVYRHHDIVSAALAITTAILKENGVLIVKVFKKKNDDLLGQQIASFFREVTFAKPEGSRDSSLEYFAVCSGHFCPLNYSPRMLLDYFAGGTMEPFRDTTVPFVIYGETNPTTQIINKSFESASQAEIVSSDLDFFTALTIKESAPPSEQNVVGLKETDLVNTPNSPVQNFTASVESVIVKSFEWKSLFPSLKECMDSLAKC